MMCEYTLSRNDVSTGNGQLAILASQTLDPCNLEIVRESRLVFSGIDAQSTFHDLKTVVLAFWARHKGA
jgi:hypothetical protein